MQYEHLSNAGPSETYHRMLKEKAEVTSERLSLIYDERSAWSSQCWRK